MLKRVALVVLLALLGGMGWRAYHWVYDAPPDPLDVARLRMDAHDVRSAQALARRVLRAEPRSAAAHLMLARIGAILADWPSVEREARALRGLGYDRMVVTPLLAEAFIRQGEPQAILTEIPAAGSRPEERAVNLAARSRAFMAMGERGQAQTDLAAAAELAPGNAEVLLQQARAALSPGVGGRPDLDVARGKVEAALGAQPQSLPGLLLKARVLAAGGDLDGAVQVLGDGLGMMPDSPQLHMARASLLVRLGEDDGARTDVQAVLAVTPRDEGANYLNAVLLLRGHHLAEGAAELEKLGGALDRHPEGYLLRARAAAELGQPQAALDSLDRILRLEPGNVEALMLAARIALDLKQPSRAAAALEQLVREGGDGAEVEDLLGQAYFQLGRREDAVRAYGRAVELAPGIPAFAAHLAAARGQFGAAPLPAVATGPSSD